MPSSQLNFTPDSLLQPFAALSCLKLPNAPRIHHASWQMMGAGGPAGCPPGASLGSSYCPITRIIRCLNSDQLQPQMRNRCLD